MNAEIFVECLRNHGHLVIRTSSSYWYGAGPRGFEDFPYHRLIEPTEKDPKGLLLKKTSSAHRYSASKSGPRGKISCHAVCADSDYNLAPHPRPKRLNVRFELEKCSKETISLFSLGTHLSFGRYDRTGEAD